MTQISSICRALLDGETVSIMTGFKDFGCTNIPREIGNVERKFGINVNREKINFVSRYKQTGYYMKYSFTPAKQKKDALKKMKQYVNEQESK